MAFQGALAQTGALKGFMAKGGMRKMMGTPKGQGLGPRPTLPGMTKPGMGGMMRKPVGATGYGQDGGQGRAQAMRPGFTGGPPQSMGWLGAILGGSMGQGTGGGGGMMPRSFRVGGGGSALAKLLAMRRGGAGGGMLGQLGGGLIGGQQPGGGGLFGADRQQDFASFLQMLMQAGGGGR